MKQVDEKYYEHFSELDYQKNKPQNVGINN